MRFSGIPHFSPDVHSLPLLTMAALDTMSSAYLWVPATLLILLAFPSTSLPHFHLETDVIFTDLEVCFPLSH